MGNRGNTLLSVLILINLILFTCSIPITNENTVSYPSLDSFRQTMNANTVFQSSRAVIHVDAGGGQQFLKIQDGVNAANPGDTVFIHKGIYAEHVTVSKGITLQGESSNGTIIDAGGTGTGIYVTANSVVIKFLTVRNAPQSHSAIKLSVSQNCEISQCNITDNDEGITLWAAVSNTIHNNNISGNNGWNGGIYIENSNSNRVYENKISGNDWTGIKLSGADDNGIDNNTISNNSNGIMLYGASSDTKVHYNDIYGNEMWGVFVYNVNALQVDGRNNWWGNSSGPYHATGNPQGTGDNVTDHVTFDPWLRSKRNNKIPVIGTSDITSVLEDEYFENEYNATDPDLDELEWTFGTNASWLQWGVDNHTIYGRPDNSHVGNYWVRINVSDGQGGFTKRNYTLTVENVEPMLMTADIGSVQEDVYYSNDYNSTDDGQGDIRWTMDTNAAFLSIDESTGLLNGSPGNDDVGLWWVDVTVHDGNGGSANSHFILEVTNTNDPPVINTTDLTEVNQDELYLVVYNATDIDPEDELHWLLKTNASWLSWSNVNNTLYGTPDNGDVGTYNISINVSDDNGENDGRMFKLTVHNVNDPPNVPEIKIPDNKSVFFLGEMVSFTGQGSDPDELYGDILNYTWHSNISGLLGYGENLSLSELEVGVHRIIFSVTDLAGRMANTTILLTIEEPVMVACPDATLLSPEDGTVVGTDTVNLTWRTYYYKPSVLEYSVFLGISRDDMKLVSESQAGSNYTLEGLSDGETYYWTIVPYRDLLEGICTSGVWSFTVKLNGSGGQDKADIILTGPSVIEVYPGQKQTEKITITNNRTVNTSITIILYDGGLASLSIDESVELERGDAKVVTLTLDIPSGVTIGKYTVTITASIGSVLVDELTIIVNVVKANDIDGKPSTGGENGEKGASDTLLMVIIVITIILALLALFVVISFQMKRKKKEKGISETGEAIPTDTVSPTTPMIQTAPAEPQMAATHVFIPPLVPDLAPLVFPKVLPAVSSAPIEQGPAKPPIISPPRHGKVESVYVSPTETGTKLPVEELIGDVDENELLDGDDESTAPEIETDIPLHRSEDIERIFAGLPEAKAEEPVVLEVSERLDEGDVEIGIEDHGTDDLDDEFIPVLTPIDNIS